MSRLKHYPDGNSVVIGPGKTRDELQITGEWIRTDGGGVK